MFVKYVRWVYGNFSRSDSDVVRREGWSIYGEGKQCEYEEGHF
jgi:hypothetical protein